MSTGSIVRAEPIPLVDLAWQYQVIRDQLLPAWHRTLDATAYIGGPSVSSFEAAFADYCGTEHCVGVANGTDAIELALLAAGIGVGDGVAMPANTFFATAEAVVRTGASPIFVDCDPDTLLMDPASLESVMASTAVRAVIPVHLYGQIAPMPVICEIAERHGAIVIEDGAQAQGARQHGAAMGTWGLAAATSFYPGKNLGAFGDAGAVVTNDAQMAARVRLLANHGSSVRYQHEAVGTNSRLDTLQADVLSAKLVHLDAWNDLRRHAAAYYDDALADVSAVTCPTVAAANHHVWHLYVIQVEMRDRVLDGLHEAGIGAGIHYPVPVHLQSALRHLGHRPGDFPCAEAAAVRLISLPLYPGITTAQQDRVIETLTTLVTARQYR